METEQLSRLIKAVIDNFANEKITDETLDSFISKMYDYRLRYIDEILEIDKNLYIEIVNSKDFYIETRWGKPIEIDPKKSDLSKGWLYIKCEVK